MHSASGNPGAFMSDISVTAFIGSPSQLASGAGVAMFHQIPLSRMAASVKAVFRGFDGIREVNPCV